MMKDNRLAPARRRRLVAAMSVALLVLPALAAGSPVSAHQGTQTASASCAEPVTSAPTGRATVSIARTAYGRVLVIGSGQYQGCSLYLLTSDAVHAQSGADFACSDNTNPLGAACDTILWPALLTDGAPIAGPGVSRKLLGTVTRNDILGSPVQQVTYGGFPLYRFFLDEEPGETEGANLFDPVTSPTGTWYMVEPKHGHAAPGRARVGLETAPLHGTGPDETVLSVTMDNDFSVFQNAAFPVYTLSTDRTRGHGRLLSACDAACSTVLWPPVLTDGHPIAGPGVDEHDLGSVRRPDGSRQVTYKGQPLYLFFRDAYIGPPVGVGIQGINGAGANTPWGVFDTVPPVS
jgi:predicted lipoprotein with Yx(FWY)xxD motif